jgi:thymidylate synthase
LWYLAKSDRLAFIRYYIPEYKKYSDDGKTLYGAYGPRLFGMRGHDQVASLIKTLGESRDSRRAVIQLFNAEDIAAKPRPKEIPCTCSFQFMIRRERLDMITFMRSNDAYWGLPHDVFAFTMLQEIIARSLGIEIGIYKHFVGSLHLYDSHAKHAQQYVEEGWQPKQSAAMPSMPWADPRPSIAKLLKAESVIRNGKEIEIKHLKLDPYWADLARLLLVFRHSKKGEFGKIAPVRKQMASHVYNAYIIKRIRATHAAPEHQMKFPYVDENEGGEPIIE